MGASKVFETDLMTSNKFNPQQSASKKFSTSGYRFRIVIPFVFLIIVLIVAMVSFSSQGEISTQLILISVGATLAVVGLGLLMARQIDQRISRIISAANSVAEGDFSVQIEDNHNDEIGRFVDVFNHMVTSLDGLHHRTDLLSRTMSPQVRQWLTERGLDFRGITQDVSILFVDIRDFTRITENHNTEQVVFFLNDYYTTIANLVHVGGGIIGKYGGDSILAFFGAPDPEQPEKSSTGALLTALALQDALVEMNQRWTFLGLPAIQVGIGISFGPVVAGPIGSEEQFEYTIIGDAVNLASRLQDLTRNMPGYSIIISAEIYQALEEKIKSQISVVSLQAYEAMSEKERMMRLFQFVDFGEVLVKGKKGPVHVYGIPE